MCKRQVHLTVMNHYLFASRNIGNNNNNVNNQNVLMFNPMMGRRSLMLDTQDRFKRSLFYDDDYCDKNSEIPTWLKEAAIQSLDLFLRLQNCSNSPKCHQAEIQESQKHLRTINDEDQRYVMEHLFIGSAKIGGGLDF